MDGDESNRVETYEDAITLQKNEWLVTNDDRQSQGAVRLTSINLDNTLSK